MVILKISHGLSLIGYGHLEDFTQTLLKGYGHLEDFTWTLLKGYGHLEDFTWTLINRIWSSWRFHTDSPRIWSS